MTGSSKRNVSLTSSSGICFALRSKKASCMRPASKSLRNRSEREFSLSEFRLLIVPPPYPSIDGSLTRQYFQFLGMVEAILRPLRVCFLNVEPCARPYQLLLEAWLGLLA